MSTEYELKRKLGMELTLYEHSNLFDICVDEFDGRCCSIDDLTTEELKEITQKLVNVISFFDHNYNGCKVSY